jgi:hypothetical protein
MGTLLEEIDELIKHNDGLDPKKETTIMWQTLTKAILLLAKSQPKLPPLGSGFYRKK